MISKREKANETSKDQQTVKLPIGVTILRVLIWLAIMVLMLHSEISKNCESINVNIEKTTILESIAH